MINDHLVVAMPWGIGRTRLRCMWKMFAEICWGERCTVFSLGGWGCMAEVVPYKCFSC